MTEIKTLSLTNRKEWRKWLESNHNKEKEIWLIHYKKHSEIKGISYKDALEEAICFGWIDSKMKGIDDEKFILRYSPRKKNSVWSEINKNTALKMIKEGKITEEGLAKIEEAKRNGNWVSAYTSKRKPDIPPDLKKALLECENAWEKFNKFSNTSQLQYVFWVNTAKLKTTREKRIKEVVKRASS
ncbi:MAG: YdeI/OmpD-associated family protein [bacterium]|nr:YdeI/OmpD-associated family protein [bacterium]